MSKCKYALFSILTFISFTISVGAATCNYEERAELNNEISNITANYEVIQVVLDPDEFVPPEGITEEEEEAYVATTDALQINILNITENVYIIVTNDYDDTTLRYNYNDTTDGNISIVWRTLGSLVTYTIEVYSSNETSCEDTLLRTLRVSLPRYNDYSTYSVCSEVPDYYLCQRYVYFDEVDFNEFSTGVLEEIERVQLEQEENENDNTPWYEAIIEFISEHKTPIIIGGLSVLIITGVIVVLVIKRRRRSEL